MDDRYLHDASYFSEYEYEIFYDSDSSPPPYIGKNKYNKKALEELLNSDKPQHKTQLESIIIESIQENDIDILEFLISKKCKVLDVFISEKQQTAIHIAYYHNAHFVLHMLSELIPHNHITCIDHNGLTLLHIGCSINDKKLIQRCLDNNVDINVPIHYDSANHRNGFTALHFAFSLSPDIVGLLLQNGADVNAVDSLGRQPLHVFCHYFSKYGLDTDSVDDNINYLKIFELLLENGDINAKDNNGNTPLLSVFPDQYIDFNDFTSFPLQETVLKIKILIQKGANLNIASNDGDNILHRAIRMLSRSIYSKDDMLFDKAMHLKLIEIIINSNQIIDVNLANVLGETPLQLAVSLASAPIVELLLHRNADFSCITFNQNDQYCFCYPNKIPTLEVVQNVIRIMYMLLNEGFQLKLEENLIIMTFLVHDLENCECYGQIDSNFEEIFNFASAYHLKYVLMKVIKEQSKDNYNAETLRAIVKSCYFKKVGGFFIDHATIDFIDALKIECNFDEEQFADIETEISLMKSMSLQDNITLYDILLKNPHEIAHYIINSNFLELRITHNFPIFENVIRGHVTKCLIRNYVEDSAQDYIAKLNYYSSLPLICWKLIFKHLSNEDILHLCIAIACS